MIDNGLLSYYPFFATKQGFLKMRALNYKRLTSTKYDTIKSYQCDEGVFWSKQERSDEMDSQILLSQIYQKADIKSAIYLPAVDPQNHRVTISNNISHESNISGKDFFRKLYERYPTEVVDGELIKHNKDSQVSPQQVGHFSDSIRSARMILDSQATSPCMQEFKQKGFSNDLDFVSFFTKEGMRDFIKMHLFDTGSYNFDRNSSNFYFEFDKQGKICGVTTIDHSMSADSVLYDHPDSISYYSFIGPYSEVNRSEMLLELKENETVQEFLPASEMADMVGQIDVVETAKDVKREINYKIDQKYVDGLASSYENLANDLVK